MFSRDHAMTRESELALAVYAELVDRLFSNAISIACMGVLFAIFGAFVADRMRDPVVLGLVAAGSVNSMVHVATVLLYRRRQRRDDRAALRRWEIRYGVTGFCGAALVGLAASRTFLGDDLGSGMLMTGLLFGYAAGTMARSAARPWMTGPRIIALVATPVLALGSRFDLLHGAQSVMLVLFTLTGLETMLSLHRQAVAEIRTSLRHNEAARRDPLTALANRLALGEFLARNAADGRLLAVHCLDLDGFKTVNDVHGHPVGDLLLQAVAERLTALVQPGDLVARLGGDEFALVQVQAAQAIPADLLAAHIVEALRRPYRLGDIAVDIGASVGVAVATPQVQAADDLLSRADVALYVSKARGRGVYTLRPGPAAEPMSLAS